MLSQLAGFTLTRTIPDGMLMGVLTGANKIYGGVIRNESGQIVAHLVNAVIPNSLFSVVTAPIDLILGAYNTVQLHRIGKNVSEVLALAKGTMFLSGLTLAASAAGFLFLNKRIGEVDKRLQAIAKEVKSIRTFLELQERARLVSALKVIRELEHIEDESARTQILVNSRQTLGEIYEKYKSLLVEDRPVYELMPVEEYFVISAIGHAMCSAELCMFSQAAKDMHDAYVVWRGAAQSFVGSQVINSNPERFLTQRYVDHIKSAEIVDWLEFAEGSGKGLDRLDDLRASSSWITVPKIKKLDPKEVESLKVARKLIGRDNVLQGYISQYDYYAETKQRPSQVQRYFDSLPSDDQVDGCFMFLSNKHLELA